ncbi:hypothetical protein PPACK8108_LOCUS7377 [Phakopsora pachyrhizi]|uniref:Uncharacterized protein n=1 Tax=Phakopsora pachyrhizi TaxID=170000 RepID=A0AAV0AW34_PHAPC|nr:hypothetical protein PPACK8108_LOCUS7377 [Phakopsora pachyrhizi]
MYLIDSRLKSDGTCGCTLRRIPLVLVILGSGVISLPPTPKRHLKGQAQSKYCRIKPIDAEC